MRRQPRLRRPTRRARPSRRERAPRSRGEQVGAADEQDVLLLGGALHDTPEEAAVRFDHRIDFVLTRRAADDGSPMPVDVGWVTGKDPDERTPATPIGRLWPSDHAGVAIRLRP